MPPCLRTVSKCHTQQRAVSVYHEGRHVEEKATLGHLSKYYCVSATDTVGSQLPTARLSRDMVCLSLGYEAVECFLQTVSPRFDVDYV